MRISRKYTCRAAAAARRALGPEKIEQLGEARSLGWRHKKDVPPDRMLAGGLSCPPAGGIGHGRRFLAWDGALKKIGGHAPLDRTV
jgi:hypothetical protein